MTTRRFLLALLTFLAAAMRADDGIWLPSQMPALAPELRRLGLQFDPAAFTDLTGWPMGALVHLGNCSGSFVSPDGLIVTNHHCVYGALQFNSTPQRDLIKDGFLAHTRGEEVQALPDARVYVTTSSEDVTQKILGDIPAQLDDAARAQLLVRRTRQLVDDCEKPGNVRCTIPASFDGAQTGDFRFLQCGAADSAADHAGGSPAPHKTFLSRVHRQRRQARRLRAGQRPVPAEALPQSLDARSRSG
ncbi:MAG TPA: S46 family peptidase [Thermoanaerobaculia bacterium]|nr:S46 family peptidase [Thermoanaerobaculia bacterium]